MQGQLVAFLGLVGLMTFAAACDGSLEHNLVGVFKKTQQSYSFCVLPG